MNYLYLKDLHGGGVQKVHLNISKGLIESGTKINLIVDQFSREQKFTNYAESIFNNSIETVGSSISSKLVSLYKLFRKHEFNTVMVGNGREALLCSLIKIILPNTLKIIYVQHVDIKIPNKPLWYNGIRRLLFKLPAHLADKLIFVSESLKNSMVDSYPFIKNKSECIYNPVFFSTENTKSEPALRPKEFMTDAYNIVNVGRLSFQKNQSFLLEVIKQLNEKNGKHYLLHLVGDGEDRHLLETQIKKLNISKFVIFHGWQSNPTNFINHADMFCLVSRWEGLPTVLIEALTYPVKLVAYNCPHGVKEILLDGKVGNVVQEYNVTAFVQAVIDEKNKPRPKISERKLERFDYEKSIILYDRILKELN